MRGAAIMLHVLTAHGVLCAVATHRRLQEAAGDKVLRPKSAAVLRELRDCAGSRLLDPMARSHSLNKASINRGFGGSGSSSSEDEGMRLAAKPQVPFSKRLSDQEHREEDEVIDIDTFGDEEISCNLGLGRTAVLLERSCCPVLPSSAARGVRAGPGRTDTPAAAAAAAAAADAAAAAMATAMDQLLDSGSEIDVPVRTSPVRTNTIQWVAKDASTTNEGALVITGVRKGPAVPVLISEGEALHASGIAAAQEATQRSSSSHDGAPKCGSSSQDGVAAPQPRPPSVSNDHRSPRVSNAGQAPGSPKPVPALSRKPTPYEVALTRLQAKYSKHNAMVALAASGGPEVGVRLCMMSAAH